MQNNTVFVDNYSFINNNIKYVIEFFLKYIYKLNFSITIIKSELTYCINYIKDFGFKL